MVKGVSRQVIVVHAPEPKMFEQAIFILKDGAVGQDGITEDALLKEAKQLLHHPIGKHGGKFAFYGPVWACGGAALTGLVWWICSLL